MDDDISIGYNAMGSDGYHEVGLDDMQDQVLALLPLPGAALSFVGSLLIICMAIRSRMQRKWTPYTRLMVGLSLCEIIGSVSYAMTAFMRPQGGQERSWSFGNDATCTASGTLTQFSFSSYFYHSMISIYFLMTLRFEKQNNYIAKWAEPLMHFVSLCYPLATAIIGAVMGVYAKTAYGMGCWVNDYPRGCGDGLGQEQCRGTIIGVWFFGLPYMSAQTIIIGNTLLIWIHMRQQRYPLQLQRQENNTSVSDTSGPLDGSPNSEKQIAKILLCYHGQQELKRIDVVTSQAMLYTASFSICNFCLGLTAIAETSQDQEQELEMLDTLYPLLCLNSILLPLQGVFNLLIYMRPNYVHWRHAGESRWCAAKRAIFGPPDAQLAQLYSSFRGDKKKRLSINEAAGADVTNTDLNAVDVGGRNSVSPWTHEDSEASEEPDDWGFFPTFLENRAVFSLEPISELVESVFDPILVETSDEESLVSSNDSFMDMPLNPECRWSSSLRSQEEDRSTSPMSVPRRRRDNNEEGEEVKIDHASNENTPSRTEGESSSTFSAPRSAIDLPELQAERVILPIVSSMAVDTPIRVPVRRLSPPPNNFDGERPPPLRPPSQMEYN